MKGSVKIWFPNFLSYFWKKFIVWQKNGIFVCFALMISLNNVDFIIAVIDKYSNKYNNRYNNKYSNKYNNRYNNKYSNKYNNRYNNKNSSKYNNNFLRLLLYS